MDREKCGVYHYVYFRNMGEAAKEIVENVGLQLMEYQDVLKIVDIAIGHRANGKMASDSHFKARLKIDQDFDHYLVVGFREYGDLIDYYSHPVHCDIRRELYRRMSEGLAVLYELMDRTEFTDRERAALFEQVIEPVVAGHILRQDFIEQGSLKYIDELK